MNRNDFLVALFGRLSGSCKAMPSGDGLEERRVFSRHVAGGSGSHGNPRRVRPEDLWWFDTVCGSCQGSKGAKSLFDDGSLAQTAVENIGPRAGI